MYHNLFILSSNGQRLFPLRGCYKATRTFMCKSLYGHVSLLLGKYLTGEWLKHLVCVYITFFKNWQAVSQCSQSTVILCKETKLLYVLRTCALVRLLHLRRFNRCLQNPTVVLMCISQMIYLPFCIFFSEMSVHTFDHLTVCICFLLWNFHSFRQNFFIRCVLYKYFLLDICLFILTTVPFKEQRFLNFDEVHFIKFFFYGPCSTEEIIT